MGYFPELAEALRNIGIQNELHYHHRNWLLHQPIVQMIKLFRADNALFTRVVSHGMVASHLGVCMTAYRNGLKRSKDG